MKIALGCDHGGYELKQFVMKTLEKLGYEYEDFGCYSTESCDYPDFGAAAARAVAEGKCDRGIVICTTGIGISIAANKIKGIRCAHCADCLEAEMTRRHNDANMMAIGAGFTGKNMAERMVEVFLTTEFEGVRHQRLQQLPRTGPQGKDFSGHCADPHYSGLRGLPYRAGTHDL